MRGLIAKALDSKYGVLRWSDPEVVITDLRPSQHAVFVSLRPRSTRTSYVQALFIPAKAYDYQFTHTSSFPPIYSGISGESKRQKSGSAQVRYKLVFWFHFLRWTPWQSATVTSVNLVFAVPIPTVIQRRPLWPASLDKTFCAQERYLAQRYGNMCGGVLPSCQP
jgi:hypothetical protein